MRKSGHFFPEQHENEKIILFTRRHWLVFFGHLFVSLVAGVILEILIYFAYVYIPIFQDDPIYSKVLIIIGSIVALLAWLIIYIGWVDYYLDVWIVSNERIVEIKQNSLFNRQISELQLEDIEDVNAKVVGFWGTILRYGTIFIQTAAATEMFEFLKIPQPYEVQKIVLILRSEMEKESKLELADLFDGKARTVRQIKPLIERNLKKNAQNTQDA
ncbi:MAG: hypothetical protein ACD_63C00221G0004 [uncultured bacterium]|nr:MAG: hypothetical protein ACD_63C00221G0004 [uncultured bacterium]